MIAIKAKYASQACLEAIRARYTKPPQACMIWNTSLANGLASPSCGKRYYLASLAKILLVSLCETVVSSLTQGWRNPEPPPSLPPPSPHPSPLVLGSAREYRPEVWGDISVWCVGRSVKPVSHQWTCVQRQVYTRSATRPFTVPAFPSPLAGCRHTTCSTL